MAYTPEQLSAAFAPKSTGLVDAEAAAKFLAQASFGPTVASLATWMGVPASDLPTIFPNTGEFNEPTLDLLRTTAR